MSFITSLLGVPLGWIMYAFYFLTNNYVFALLLFTIVTRAIMIPTSVKQQKSTVKMAIIKPELDELQKKYANNKEKLNEEMMKLYSREGYSPTAGCLPLLIQFPILFGLIDVIYKPMTHILRISSETIAIGSEIVKNNAALFNLDAANQTDTYIQLQIIRAVREMPDKFVAMGQDAVSAIQGLNMNFLGMDLTQTPALKMFTQIFSDFNPIIFIPIAAGVTSLIMSLVTMRNSATTVDGSAGASMKGMMYMMPLFSAWIALRVPAGVGIYWSFSSIIGTVQAIVMHKIYNPKELAEKAKAEAAERREQERLARIEAKKNDPNRGLSQKELNRRKLAEARKRDAEKYGEEYVEVTDKDLV